MCERNHRSIIIIRTRTKEKKLNILNHTSSRAANYLYSAPMKWARQVNDHSRATERTNTEKRTNTHFPNKEIDFYNWRQLRHTAEFIFQFMFWMRNCFARTYHIHCDWINDGIGVREWRFCSRTSLIIIISDSKMFFFGCLLLYLPTGFRYVCDSSQRTVAVHCVVGWCVPFFVVYPANWLNWPNGYQNGMYSSAFFLLLYCKFEALVRQFRLKISGCDGFFACYFIDVQVWAVTQVCRATHSCTRTHDMALFAVLLWRVVKQQSSNELVMILWYV